MSRWPEVALGEVLTQQRREELVRSDRDYRLLGAHWYAKGLYVKDEKPGVEIRADKLYRVAAGDFVYNRLFAWKGSFAVASEAVDGCHVSNEFPCFEVDRDHLEPRYLWLYFSREEAWNSALGLSFGATPTSRNRLKETNLLSMIMPLPPIEEQRRVVRRTEQLASQVDEAGRHQRSIEVALSVASKSIAAQTLRRMPDAIWTRLRDVVEIRGGNTPSKGNPAYWGGEVPWITPKDMKQRVLSDSEDHVTEVALSEGGSRLHEPGCVLVVVRGMILAHTFPAAVLGTSATINQDMKTLRPTRGLLPEYLCHALWGFNDEILGLVDRSGHDTRKLTTGRLADFRFPMPPIADQRRVVRFLDRALSIISGLRVRQEHTQATMDVLLPSFVGNLVG